MDIENQQLIPERQAYGGSKQERRELRRQEKTDEQNQRNRKRIYRRIVIWSVVAFVIGGAIFGTIQLAQAPTDNSKPVSLVAIADDDWVKGSREANVVLVEYSDFQCPACASYHPLLKELTSEFGNDIAFVYRHFPLRQIHPNAQLAGQAAEAAGKQNRFWEMHDMIFENQQEWSNQGLGQAEDAFISYAGLLNLDIAQFKTTMNSKEAKDKVNSDYQNGVRSRVNSTPTFFLNGERIQNSRNYDEFKNIINQAIDNNF